MSSISKVAPATLLAAGLAFSSAPALADSGLGIYTFGVNAKATDSISVYGGLSRADNALSPGNKATLIDLHMKQKLSDNWSYSLGYFGIRTDIGASELRDDRARAAVMYDKAFDNGLIFSHRSMISRRFINDRDHSTRYRPRFELKYPTQIGGIKMIPVVGYEEIHDLTHKTRNNSLTTIGAHFPLPHNFMLSALYTDLGKKSADATDIDNFVDGGWLILTKQF